MKTIFLPVAALATMIAAVPALAQGPGGPPQGPQTRAEYVAAQAARFKMMDANGDGTVTKDEATAAMTRDGNAPPAQMIDRLFGQMDTNGDGKAMAAEAAAGADARFTALDTDKDGTLTPDERRAGFQRPQQ